MKRSILVLFALSLFLMLSYGVCGAQFIADSPFTGSFVEVFPSFNSFGDTAVIVFESTDNFGSFFAFLLDANGVPVATSATGGWVYLFADIRADGSLAIYGSNTGLSNDWHQLF